jgi:RHS repeat-associated protein
VSVKVHNGGSRGVTEAPFGNIIRSTGDAADDNPFRFSTRYYDQETGLYAYPKRYYDPELGRWLSRDPAEELGGDNLYAFVLNDPIGLVDPFGLAALDGAVSGVPDCGVLIYLTHNYNLSKLDVSGNKGCRRAGIVSCMSARDVPGIGSHNLIDIPLSDGMVGDSPSSDNGGHGPGLAGFIAYMKAVFTKAKSEAEGLCPPKIFLDEPTFTPSGAEDKCNRCQYYRDNHWTYSEGAGERIYSGSDTSGAAWMEFDRDVYDCCHCKKITFKFFVPNSDDNRTYRGIINRSRGDWADKIGLGNGSIRTYDCKKKQWSGGSDAIFK